MSVGLIKLTSISNEPFFINPLQITLFTPSTPSFCHSLCGNADACVQGATTVIIGSLPVQFKESPKEIISALVRLRNAQQKQVLKAVKDDQKEAWEEGYDDTEDQDNG